MLKTRSSTGKEDVCCAQPFTMEAAEDNIHFQVLDIYFERRVNGIIRRSVYHKSTWSRYYLRFLSFCPVHAKRGLVRTSFSRAWRTCSSETLMGERGNPRKVLRNNGYPKGFIMKYGQEGQQQVRENTAPKWQVSITLHFKGDEMTNAIGKRLKDAVERTYMAASLRILFETKLAVREIQLDRPSSLVTYNFMYQFECAWSRRYIERTERILEHIPRNLTLGGDRLPGSFIVKHLPDMNPQVDPRSAFKIVFKNRDRRILRFADAAAIRCFKQDLWKQLDVWTSLALMW
jgi:hypothetical protein